jgi:hypothetical protein
MRAMEPAGMMPWELTMAAWARLNTRNEAV